MTISDPVRRHAEARPDAPALVTGAATWSWADLHARVSGTARRIGGGDGPLAVRAETSPDLVVLVLAALRAGRLLVPLSTRWAPALIAETVIAIGATSLLSDAPVAGLDTVPLGTVVGEEEDGPAPPIPLDRPFTVVHTSGSTGRPKAIVHTVGNHVWSARGVVEALGFGPGDRWLLDLPLYHVGGLGVVVRSVLAGGTVAVPAPGVDPFETLRPTHASLVATQLRRLLDRGADLSSLRAVLLGGSAIPPDLLDEAVRKSVPVVVSYGMTEMTSTVSATAPGADRAALATSGRPLPYRDVRLSAEGEIEVGGPCRFLGTLTADGIVPAPEWHPTGDLGRFDAEGHLVVTGRKDLQFVSGGENVRPEAIEAALLALDAVAEAVVVPVPDAVFGCRPAAFVRPATDAGVDGVALASALRKTLAGFQIPVAFFEWGGAEGMKPDRPALAARAARLIGGG